MFEQRNPIVLPRTEAARLAGALLLSLLFHALLLGSGLISPPDRRVPDMPEPLQAVLLPEPAAPPQLVAPEPASAEAPSVSPTVPPPEAPINRPLPPVDPRSFTASEPVPRDAPKQAQPLYYPIPAVIRGQEGEAIVRVFLDESGNAIAARLERSSGYPMLDDAAVRAARSVRALPGGTFGEMLLPVRFRLR